MAHFLPFSIFTEFSFALPFFFLSQHGYNSRRKSSGGLVVVLQHLPFPVTLFLVDTSKVSANSKVA